MNTFMTNGKLHGYGVGQDAYRMQTCKRGERGYVVGRSDLHAIACCPHKWLTGGDDDKENKSTEWGTLLDALLFDGDMGKFVERPATYMGEDKKKNPVEKEWNWNATVCQEWRERQVGKQIVKSETMEEAKRAAKIFKSDPELAALLKGAKFQAMVTADYADKDTGIVVKLKGLVDIVPHEAGRFADCLSDGKTARYGAVESWGRVVYDGWYHVQGALYLDLWNATGDSTRTRFLHAIQENQEAGASYEVGRREITDQFLRLGRGQYQAALSIYCRCLQTGVWPGLDEPGQWTPIDCEPWMLMRAGIAPTDAEMPEIFRD